MLGLCRNPCSGNHRGNSRTRWQRWPGSTGESCGGSAKAAGQPAVSVPGKNLSKMEAWTPGPLMPGAARWVTPSAEFAGLRFWAGGGAADLPEATRGSKYHKDQADGQLGSPSEQLSLPASRLHPPPAV